MTSKNDIHSQQETNKSQKAVPQQLKGHQTAQESHGTRPSQG
jgi:hypothetical protein